MFFCVLKNVMSDSSSLSRALEPPPVSAFDKIKVVAAWMFFGIVVLGLVTVLHGAEKHYEFLHDPATIKEYEVARNSVELCKDPDRYGLVKECPVRMRHASGTFETMVWHKTLDHLREDRSWLLSAGGICSTGSLCWYRLNQLAEVLVNSVYLSILAGLVLAALVILALILVPGRLTRLVCRKHKLHTAAVKRKQQLREQEWAYNNPYRTDIDAQMESAVSCSLHTCHAHTHCVSCRATPTLAKVNGSAVVERKVCVRAPQHRQDRQPTRHGCPRQPLGSHPPKCPIGFPRSNRLWPVCTTRPLTPWVWVWESVRARPTAACANAMVYPLARQSK